jgi:DNA-binding HxlR family transcriptional regulator
MAKPQPNICSAHCPSRELLELLAEKWALLVIFRLRVKEHRTAELRREIGGVSEKMLIQTLRKLERFGIVERFDFGEVPPRVEYRLTPLGASLSLPVERLERWVAKNIFDVLRAKAKFDAKSAKLAGNSMAKAAAKSGAKSTARAA